MAEDTHDSDEIIAMKEEIDALKTEVEELKKPGKPLSITDARFIGFVLWWVFILIVILLVSQLPPIRL